MNGGYAPRRSSRLVIQQHSSVCTTPGARVLCAARGTMKHGSRLARAMVLRGYRAGLGHRKLCPPRSCVWYSAYAQSRYEVAKEIFNVWQQSKQ